MTPSTFSVHQWRHLVAQAAQRRKSAYRPGTIANHQSHIRNFIAFCLYFKVKFVSPTIPTVCCFIEFLATELTPASITNYISSLKWWHKLINKPANSLYSFEVSLMLRALRINMSHRPNRRLPISLQQLRKIVNKCKHLGRSGPVYKCAILFAFFGFLRQSNLAPTSTQTFNKIRNVCQGDVISHPPGLVVILRWTKTNQTGDTVSLIPLPNLGTSSLCPVKAFHNIQHLVPASKNKPLFLLPPRPRTKKPRVLTISKLRYTFNKLLKAIGISTTRYSLHSLRRGGASVSYQSGVRTSQIQLHGTWQSQSFWRYIITDVHNSQVALNFKNLLHT